MSEETVLAEKSVTRKSSSLVELIEATIHNPQVDPAVIEQFLKMQERIEAIAAERAFNSAFLAMQQELPAIVKDGKIDLGKGKPMPFASFENVMQIVKPKMRAHGFSESFTSEETPSGVLITLTLRHTAGHSKSSTMRLPADAGPGRNNLQALGSSFKYAKRYLILGMLSIVTINEGDNDKDGSLEPEKTITEKEYSNILDLISGTGTDEARFNAWACKRFGITKLSEIPANKYTECANALKAKNRSGGGNADLSSQHLAK